MICYFPAHYPDGDTWMGGGGEKAVTRLGGSAWILPRQEFFFLLLSLHAWLFK